MTRPRRYYALRGVVRGLFWPSLALLAIAVMSLDSPVLH